MTSRTPNAAPRVRWFKAVRVAVLLLVLVVVALTTWQDRYRSTRWRQPLFVALYPIAADESPVTRSYIDALDDERFKAIDRFFMREAARYRLPTDEPIRTRLQPELRARPPELTNCCTRSAPPINTISTTTRRAFPTVTATRSAVRSIRRAPPSSWRAGAC